MEPLQLQLTKLRSCPRQEPTKTNNALAALHQPVNAATVIVYAIPAIVHVITQRSNSHATRYHRCRLRRYVRCSFRSTSARHSRHFPQGVRNCAGGPGADIGGTSASLRTEA